jgi:hypothetical protein
VIAAQFGRDAVLALTVTCGAADKADARDPLLPSSVESCPVNPGKRSTIADVAREAKVSNSTVSRVLNDYWSIGAETQKRVEAAMRRLEYKPNEAARTMVRSKRTRRQRHAGTFAIADGQTAMADSANGD